MALAGCLGARSGILSVGWRSGGVSRRYFEPFGVSWNCRAESHSRVKGVKAARQQIVPNPCRSNNNYRTSIFTDLENELVRSFSHSRRASFSLVATFLGVFFTFALGDFPCSSCELFRLRSVFMHSFCGILTISNTDATSRSIVLSIWRNSFFHVVLFSFSDSEKMATFLSFGK